MLADARNAQAAGMHPVGADLCGHIHAVAGHDVAEGLHQAKILLPLIQAVAIVWIVQHPAMNADAWRAEAQKKFASTSLVHNLPNPAVRQFFSPNHWWGHIMAKKLSPACKKKISPNPLFEKKNA